MTYVIYVDVMLLWSSVINVVVLILATAILDMHIKPLRIIVWALATGAVTTAEYILLLGGNKFLHYILYVAIYIFMTTCFFTYKSLSGSVRFFVTIIISMLVIYGIWGIIFHRIKTKAAYPIFFILVFFLAFLLKNTWKYKEYEKNIYDVFVFANQKCIRCRGYMDSGNMLYDYASAYPVIVISIRLGKKILGENFYRRLEAYGKTGSFDFGINRGEDPISVYPIFYSTVERSGAVMPGFKINKLCILEKNKVFTNVVAAISKNLTHGNDYQLLLHSCMKGEFK